MKEASLSSAVPAKAPAKPRRLFIEGDELYAAMLDAIRGARHSIKLESYIFADDEIGRQFAAALGERARAGVQVLVNIDAAGSLFWASRRLEKALKRDGVEVHWFHRWSWRDPWRYNRRNHRKLLVVDGRVGFLGGFNIHRENSRKVYGETRWRDTHVEVRGQLARNLQALFDAFWRGQRRRYPVTRSADGNLITNHSHRGRLLLRNLYAARFAISRQRIWLTTPYFVPDRRTQRSLMAAARRDVDVRVLVPHKSDVRIAQWAARAAYAALLAAGVRIYKYRPRMLHAKTVTIDGAWCSVGTANIDYRSFFLNYELTLTSRDSGFVAVLETQFLTDLEQSEQIFPARWAQRGWLTRVLEFIGWLGRRWL
ncbi:MAG: phospholipase D-like domain-containing protein [Gammaproteobacteria bacterium]